MRNTSVRFRISVRFVGPAGIVSALFTRPLLEREIVTSLSHSISFQLIYKYLLLTAEFFPELETQIRIIRSLIRFPVDFCGVN